MKDIGMYWWVAPTYELSEIGLRKFKKWSDPKMRISINYSKHVVYLKGGSTLWFKSGDHPDRLVGEGLKGVVIDEAARCKVDIWDYNIRPCLSDYKGWAIFISTPRGHNWFYKLYQRGLNPLETSYQSFHYTSYDNPHLPEGEVDEAKGQLPDLAFRQEYLAEFIQDGAGVFRGVRNCIDGALVAGLPWSDEPTRGEIYLMGVDLGRSHDFTAICVMDSARRLVHFDRFTGIPWALQKERIQAAAVKFNNAQALIDKTGLGQPVVEDLATKMNALGFQYTNQSKEDIINSLAISIEQGLLSYPEIPELITELEAFDYAVSTTGKYTYNAPAGYFDDCVNALALCNYQHTSAYHLERKGAEAGRAIY